MVFGAWHAFMSGMDEPSLVVTVWLDALELVFVAL